MKRIEFNDSDKVLASTIYIQYYGMENYKEYVDTYKEREYNFLKKKLYEIITKELQEQYRESGMRGCLILIDRREELVEWIIKKQRNSYRELQEKFEVIFGETVGIENLEKKLDQELAKESFKEQSEQIAQRINLVLQEFRLFMKSMEMEYMLDCDLKNIYPSLPSSKVIKRLFTPTYIVEESDWIRGNDGILDIKQERKEQLEKENIYNKWFLSIGNNFLRFYTAIKESVEKGYCFIEADLTYILLMELVRRTGEEYEIKVEQILDWEEEHEFLSTLKKDLSKDKKMRTKQYLKELDKQLVEGKKYRNFSGMYVDIERNCLCIKKFGAEFEISFLMYKNFRNRFCKSGYHRLASEKIDEISSNIGNIEIDRATEVMEYVSLYLNELFLGDKLCANYTTFYREILSSEECIGQERVKCESYLKRIFQNLCIIPFVGLRMFIMKQFMKPIMIFGRKFYDQLMVVDRMIFELKETYCKMTEEVLNAAEKVKDETGIEKKRLEEEIMKWGDITDKAEEIRDEDLYRDLQKIYVKEIKNNIIL